MRVVNRRLVAGEEAAAITPTSHDAVVNGDDGAGGADGDEENVEFSAVNGGVAGAA